MRCRDERHPEVWRPLDLCWRILRIRTRKAVEAAQEAHMDAGLLIARLIIGPGIAAHGAQKLYGWFGGHGIDGTAGFLEGLGFRPGRLFASATGVCEFFGGLLIALGLFGPVGPALVIIVMVTAMLTVHAGHGFFAESRGIELPLVNATGAFLIAVAGPGLYSMDAVLRLNVLATPAAIYATVVVAVVIAILNV